MAYYPQSPTGLNYISYPVGPTPVGLTLTANASNNTKGAYAEFVASLGFSANALRLTMSFGTTVTSYLFDIATGSGGAETVILPNILADDPVGVAVASYEPLPVSISSGTRIAGRCQASTGSRAMGVSLGVTAAGGTAGLTSYLNYGADTSTSLGTTIDPGGSANTKGSYAQLTASSSAVAQVVSLLWTLNQNTAPQTFSWMVDLATGAAASEVVLIPDVYMRQMSTATPGPTPNSRWFLTYIAASTRIAARASCSGTDATDRLLSMAMLAGTAPAESAGGGAWAFA